MGAYKTAPLIDYDLSFQDVARRLFDLASNRLTHGIGVDEKGSYSFRPASPPPHAQETVIKILIFQRGLGIQMQGALPWRNDGVYVLVRTNGEFGNALWQNPVPMDHRFASRMSRDDTVSTAPNYDARFAYFPVMAGESLGAVADFIASVLTWPAPSCVTKIDPNQIFAIRQRHLRQRVSRSGDNPRVGCC